MTHELKQIIQGYLNAKHLGLKAVMATVVELEGSSYRRPGVRMLINEHGHMTGAVSGGCVEKEILKQSHSVFSKGIPKMMSYDGRYRLGCEGTLYILIEPFDLSEKSLEVLATSFRLRTPIEIHTCYDIRIGESHDWGSCFVFKKDLTIGYRNGFEKGERLGIRVFRNILEPCFELLIIGGEHDAAQLSMMASALGWEVTVVVSPSSPQELSDFPGASKLLKQAATDLDASRLSENSAVVLMTHSFVKDLDYLLGLTESDPCYIGLLGPKNRREKMFDNLIEREVDLKDAFFDKVYGPAGLDIGSETPQEIALSICSEILSVQRQRNAISLREKTGTIHLPQ